MGMINVSVDTKRLKQWEKDIQNVDELKKEAFFHSASREMAGRLLSLVIKRTPVGQGQKDEEGRTISQGGTLRRGWLGGQNSEAAATAALDVVKVSGGYNVTVTNTTLYASYVEYGHRQTPGRYVPAIGKRLVKSWVEGQFFLKISEEELTEVAPTILETLLNDFLRQVF